MTKTVEKDFETVEKEVTKYKCDADGCENIVDESEINTVFFGEGDQANSTPYTSDIEDVRHVCESCSGLRTAVSIREEKKKKTEYIREWWDNTKIIGLLIIPSFLIGMTTMFFAFRIRESANDPFWPFDFFLSFLLQVGIAFIAFAIVTIILESQDWL